MDQVLTVGQVGLVLLAFVVAELVRGAVRGYVLGRLFPEGRASWR